MLHHLTRQDDPPTEAAVKGIEALDADILLLTGIDYDMDGATLAALNQRLGADGKGYPYLLALRPNAGVPSGLDLNHDGALNGPRDALAYGRFPGQGGMALLSRDPIGEPQDFTGLLWRDLPGANLPPDMTEAEKSVVPVSTSGHYDIPVTIGATTLHLLAYAATPPIFDGPEDRNGRRNADESLVWIDLLTGKLGTPPPEPFVVIGKPNLDPEHGDGTPDHLRALIDLMQDPKPASAEMGLATSVLKSGRGLRTDMILVSKGLRVTGAGVLTADPFPAASAHRPVWVSVAP